MHSDGMTSVTQPWPDVPSSKAASDYGSDFDAETVHNLLTQAETGDVLQVVPANPEQDTARRCRTGPLVPKIALSADEAPLKLERLADQRPGPLPFLELRQVNSYDHQTYISKGLHAESAEPDAGEVALNGASPIQCFRSPPKKPLSVTDIISPAWCELQYLYSLTKHGRKKRTSAMRAGSAVHRTLEEQIHSFIPIDVTTKEDVFALKVWNMIQGLRSLRETGHTRELEIWGVIDGEVISGVIDELSYVCPDDELEKSLESSLRTDANQNRQSAPPRNQRTLAEFFHPTHGKVNSSSWLEQPAVSGNVRRIYLTDVKTRGRRTLPSSAALRPTRMQLMLYHRLLEDLASGKVCGSTIFDRYNLEPDQPFSDTFITQVVGTSDIVRDDEGALKDTMVTFRSHPTLRQLWTLMLSELRSILPTRANLGRILAAEFRTQDTGEILGIRTFAMNYGALDDYLKDELRWWRGERQVKGVDIEEAYKCGMCEFAEGCTWRKERINEAIQRARLKKRQRDGPIS